MHNPSIDSQHASLLNLRTLLQSAGEMLDERVDGVLFSGSTYDGLGNPRSDRDIYLFRENCSKANPAKTNRVFESSTDKQQVNFFDNATLSRIVEAISHVDHEEPISLGNFETLVAYRIRIGALVVTTPMLATAKAALATRDANWLFTRIALARMLDTLQDLDGCLLESDWPTSSFNARRISDLAIDVACCFHGDISIVDKWRLRKADRTLGHGSTRGWLKEYHALQSGFTLSGRDAAIKYAYACLRFAQALCLTVAEAYVSGCINRIWRSEEMNDIFGRRVAVPLVLDGRIYVFDCG